MEKTDHQTKVQAIATHTLKVFTQLSQQRPPLDVETLALALQNSEELKTLLAVPPNADDFHKNGVLHLKERLETLQEQYDAVDAKRRELAAQLDAAEEVNIQTGAFLRRSVPALAQLARTGGNSQLVGHLDRITALVKDDASLDDLENEFQLLKESSFRVELEKQEHKAPAPKPPHIFNLFKRQAPPEADDPVAHLKGAYTQIVEELRLNLDQKALGELDAIKSRLSDVLQLEDFHPIRRKILELLKGYISRIITERTQAASFIYEVGERLLDIERQVLSSIATVQETRNATTRLTDTIDREMNTFQETVNVSTSLEELKSKIMDRISALKKVIENSRQEDLSRDILADREVAVLKKNLSRMKDEIRSAKKQSKILEAELMSDPLTQAHNRRAYDQRLVEELERFHRYNAHFSMLLLDVDHFKKINDRYGHSVGDLCLKETINRIKPLLRTPDFLARFGGEEFVIILPETGCEGAGKVAEKIRMHIENTEFLHKGDNVKVTISLGGTQVQTSDKTAEDIFERVDRAMYQAKNSGRNQVVMI
jgi:diguanylate cyclase (GGDEF)-like protein